MRKFFNDDGSVIDGMVFGDPYRAAEGEESIAALEFNEDGHPSDDLIDDATRVVMAGTAKPNSIAAQVFHANVFGNNCKSNYSPIYYWR